MSEAVATPGRRSRLRRPSAGALTRVVLVVVAVVLPYYLNTALLQTGLFSMAAILGAIGLNLLTGNTGQLSLAHAFFVAIGAYGYSYFAGTSGVQGTNEVQGLHLPPVLALVLAVALTGVAGYAFSPVSRRLRGIYLGIASLSLVFIGQHIMFNAPAITGGFNGRDVTNFSLGGFQFSDSNPNLYVLNVPFGQYERLWYLALVLVVVGYIVAKNILRGRPGRAMQMVRDSEVAAAVMGVNVRRYKTAAFVLSSMYAGLAGVLYALTFGRIVPDAFDVNMSINYLAMIVIGGLASVGGAALGAVFVTALPQLLMQYSGSVPFLAAPGSGGIDPGVFSNYVYGALIVLVVLFEPGGLAALGRRFGRGRRSRGSPGLWGWLAAGRRPGLRTAGAGPPASSDEVDLPTLRVGGYPMLEQRAEGRTPREGKRDTMKRRLWGAAAAAFTLLLVTTACSTKAVNTGGEGSGGIKTGTGVTNSTITLGVLTDLHGTFAALGKSMTNANKLYWNQQDAKGGICGRKVQIVVKDHGYDVQQALPLYQQLRTQVLSLQQALGSPINTALLNNYSQDQMLAIPSAWASTLLANKQIMDVGSTYDFEMINLIDWALQKGLIKPGDKVGHIYFEGEYGANGLLGSEYAAQKNHLSVVQEKITATTDDVSAQVSDLKSKGAKAILLTAGPLQSASAASAAEAQGFNVPLLSQNPGFAPGIMGTAAGPALAKNFYIVVPWLMPSSNNATIQQFLGAYKKAYPGAPLDGGVTYAYGASDAYRQVLQKACASKDLTRAGIYKAFRSLSSIDTNGVLPTLDYTKIGDAPTHEAYIWKASTTAVGGLAPAQEGLYKGKDVDSYTPPAVKSG